MFCTKCGKENKDDAKFCEYCNQPLVSSQNKTNTEPKTVSGTNTLGVCPNCGENMSPSQSMCFNCGYKKESTTNIPMLLAIIGGALGILVGMFAMIYFLNNVYIYDYWGYYYSYSNYSKVFNWAGLIGAILPFIGGIMGLISGILIPKKEIKIAPILTLIASFLMIASIIVASIAMYNYALVTLLGVPSFILLLVAGILKLTNTDTKIM